MCISLDDPNEHREPTPHRGEHRTRGSIQMMDDITRFIESSDRGSFALARKEETGEWMAVLSWMTPSQLKTELGMVDVQVPANLVGVDKTPGDAIEALLKQVHL